MKTRIHEHLYIGGEMVKPAGSATIEVRSPATLDLVGRVPDATTADVDRAVAAARAAFDGEWPRMSPNDRADALARLNEQLMTRQEELAEVLTSEVGSPITFSQSVQALSPTMVLGYYAELTRTFPFEELRDGVVVPKSFVMREPIGVVGAIIPWNVPLFVAITKIAPALAAGCTVVLKPPPETPLFAYVLAEAIEAAALPKGVVNIVAGGREIGEHLVKHPGVDKISFTGSPLAGRRVASLCGELLRSCTLELGGKSAAILLDDVDLAQKIPELLPFAMMNSGQACIAQTRILASKKRYAEVVDALTEEVKRQKTGDPFDAETFCGPLIAERQRARVEEYIASGKEEGARVTTGGGRPRSLERAVERGWFVEPTVFADVKSGMRIAQEEIFGPVLAVIPFDDEDDAVRIANDSRYGLSGSVWTNDYARGLAIAKRVRTGTYTVNGYVLDFATPFGGYKESGLGREMGPEGLSAFCELKSVNMPFDWQP